MMEQPLHPIERRWIFEGPLVQISRWICRGGDAGLSGERCHERHLIAFLHSGNFRIYSAAGTGLVDSRLVAFFNAGSPFQTEHPFGRGDCGSELAVRGDVLSEIMERYDPRAAEHPERPFSGGWGPCSSDAFLLQAILVRKAGHEATADPLEIEEFAVALADLVVRDSMLEAGRFRPELRAPRERDNAEKLRGYLSSAPDKPHRLDALARVFESTPWRLCRSFRGATGTTIHRYLLEVRLRRALDFLADGCRDLAGLALDLGFSSHSHFTVTFRKLFGVTPEMVRMIARAGNLEALRRRLSEPANRPFPRHSVASLPAH
jgi:AraC-like DNA-binding protein